MENYETSQAKWRMFLYHLPSMNQKILKLLCLNILIALSLCPALNAKALETKDPIFVFHTDEFWLNLHHFLYVLGRAENKERDTSREAVAGAPDDQQRGFGKLSVKDQTIWRAAVASYAAGPSKKDLVFDDPLPALTNALARAGNAKTLNASGVDPAIPTILERVAPIYRKAWWTRHREAN